VDALRINVHEVLQFIGLTSYFRKFIQGFATIVRPLTALTKNNVPFTWTTEEEESFQTLIQRLRDTTVLALYRHRAVELYVNLSYCDIKL
jgi:hypothetical protein